MAEAVEVGVAGAASHAEGTVAVVVAVGAVVVEVGAAVVVGAEHESADGAVCCSASTDSGATDVGVGIGVVIGCASAIDPPESITIAAVPTANNAFVRIREDLGGLD